MISNVLTKMSTTKGWAATLDMGLLIWFGLNTSIIWKKLTGIYTTDISKED